MNLLGRCAWDARLYGGIPGAGAVLDRHHRLLDDEHRRTETGRIQTTPTDTTTGSASRRKVCKTFIRRFDPDPRLQQNTMIPTPASRFRTSPQLLLCKSSRYAVTPVIDPIFRRVSLRSRLWQRMNSQRRDRQQPAAYYGRYGVAAESVFRQHLGVLGELAGAL